ncbi:hypothetical protein GCM10010129_70850 [Streptomyces fumigatiscleroticus]|nr:hypothetical protein GCM10010129_70850 [Streptomyces fumigatiscleroticus]
MAYRWFTDPAARSVATPEEREHQARRLVADPRATAGRRSGDPTVAGLIDRLRAASADFRLELLRVLGTEGIEGIEGIGESRGTTEKYT